MKALAGERSVVYLVGSGPGDPDLITVKGMDLLEGCDVLVHDGLVAPELVQRCPAVERHYVGKTAGGHSMRQEEINRLLVDLATAPGRPRTIVRLKGGDPYVFGRGGEEALALQEAGVPFEVVPGVTAGVASAAYCGVPVTHRSISRGVILVTGHQARGGPPHLPWTELVGSGFTLVLYMSVATLPAIVRRLLEEGLDPQTPAITIQEGTLPGQRRVAAPVSDLPRKVAEAGVRPPAVTIIGRVAALADRLGFQEPRPLAGRTVVLVRAEERHYPEAQHLRLLGARLIDVSGIRCVPRTGDEAVERMLREIASGDVVAFTSALAVRFFASRWRQRCRRMEDAGSTPPDPVFASASPALVTTMAREGLRATIAPAEMGAGRLLDALGRAGVAPGTRVWLPRAAAADRELPEALRDAGYDPRPRALYDTMAVPLPHDVVSMLRGGRVDMLVFLSGTCVDSVLESVPEIVADSPCSSARVAVIGRKTAAVATARGLRVDVMPEQPSIPALFEAVAEDLVEMG